MEQDTEDSPTGNGVPFKVVDLTREKRKGVVAASLQDLISRARDKMGLPKEIPVKIVLEQDGTEVDDDEYFGTMEKNTTLMILINDQRWLPPGKLPRYQIIVDEPDAGGTHTKRDLGGLVERLQGDLTHISMLGGKDLELLSDMDPESLADIMPDKEAAIDDLSVDIEEEEDENEVEDLQYEESDEESAATSVSTWNENGRDGPQF